jgi:hypothetical protein
LAIAFNITSFNFEVGTFCILLSYTFSPISIAFKILIFSVTEINKIGTSLNGAIFCLSTFSKSLAVLVSFSIKSHLFTSKTIPFPFLAAKLKMVISCAVIPLNASITNKQTSASSIALMARIIE